MKTKIRRLILLLVFIGINIAFAQINRFKENSWYIIIATHSNKALEIKGASKENGAQLQQNDSTGADNQLFRFKKVSISYYQIIAKQSGKVLQIRDASINESVFEQNDINGKEQQLFAFVKAANGASAIIVKASGSGFDVLGGVHALANGLPVVQYPNAGASNQYFRILEKQ